MSQGNREDFDDTTSHSMVPDHRVQPISTTVVQLRNGCRTCPHGLCYAHHLDPDSQPVQDPPIADILSLVAHRPSS